MPSTSHPVRCRRQPWQRIDCTSLITQLHIDSSGTLAKVPQPTNYLAALDTLSLATGEPRETGEKAVISGTVIDHHHDPEFTERTGEHDPAPAGRTHRLGTVRADQNAARERSHSAVTEPADDGPFHGKARDPVFPNGTGGSSPDGSGRNQGRREPPGGPNHQSHDPGGMQPAPRWKFGRSRRRKGFRRRPVPGEYGDAVPDAPDAEESPIPLRGEPGAPAQFLECEAGLLEFAIQCGEASLAPVQHTGDRSKVTPLNGLQAHQFADPFVGLRQFRLTFPKRQQQRPQNELAPPHPPIRGRGMAETIQKRRHRPFDALPFPSQPRGDVLAAATCPIQGLAERDPALPQALPLVTQRSL